MWKTGLDGTMTWCYGTQRPAAPGPDGLPTLTIGGFIVRGRETPFDTLSWEGCREGYDDARYLATLQAALATAKATGQHADLVADIGSIASFSNRSGSRTSRLTGKLQTAASGRSKVNSSAE